MKRYLVLIFTFISLFIFSEEELLKMKNGSTLKGEILNFSKDGILFKLSKLNSSVELKWDSLSEETYEKYKSKIPADKEVIAENKLEETDKPETDEPVEKLKNPLSDKNITRKFYDRYKINQKKIIKEFVNGNYIIVEEGLLIKLKDDKTVKGKMKSNKDDEITLIYNSLPITINKSDIISTEPTVYTVSKGSLEYDKLNEANNSLHDSCIALTSYDLAITSEQGAYIWKLRTTGGTLPTSEGEYKFNEYKKMTYIDLGTMGHVFVNKGDKLNNKSIPSTENWSSYNTLEKTKYLEVMNAILSGSNIEVTGKPCSMCKGEGRLMTKKDEKSSVGKDKKFGSKGGSKGAEYEKCSQCKGSKKLYTIKFQ